MLPKGMEDVDADDFEFIDENEEGIINNKVDVTPKMKAKRVKAQMVL